MIVYCSIVKFRADRSLGKLIELPYQQLTHKKKNIKINDLVNILMSAIIH